MMRLPMSPAASGLLRELIRRGRCGRDRILLTELTSNEWQSLTFVGERHRLDIRIAGPDAGSVAALMITGIEDAEFSITGQIVADVRCKGKPQAAPDGSVTLTIEALTVEE